MSDNYYNDPDFDPDLEILKQDAAHVCVKFIDLSKTEINENVVFFLSKETCIRLGAIPVSKDNYKIVVAMKNPMNIFAIDEISSITGLTVVPALASEKQILKAIEKCFEKYDFM